MLVARQDDIRRDVASILDDRTVGRYSPEEFLMEDDIVDTYHILIASLSCRSCLCIHSSPVDTGWSDAFESIPVDRQQPRPSELVLGEESGGEEALLPR